MNTGISLSPVQQIWCVLLSYQQSQRLSPFLQRAWSVPAWAGLLHYIWLCRHKQGSGCTVSGSPGYSASGVPGYTVSLCSGVPGYAVSACTMIHPFFSTHGRLTEGEVFDAASISVRGLQRLPFVPAVALKNDSSQIPQAQADILSMLSSSKTPTLPLLQEMY